MRVERLQRVCDLGDKSGEGANHLSTLPMYKRLSMLVAVTKHSGFKKHSSVHRKAISGRLSSEMSMAREYLCLYVVTIHSRPLWESEGVIDFH